MNINMSETPRYMVQICLSLQSQEGKLLWKVLPPRVANTVIEPQTLPSLYPSIISSAL